MPRNKQHRGEIGYNQYRVLEKHIKRRHDGVFHLQHIAAHTGNNIALALFGEEAQRQGCYLLVQLVTNVAHHACADGHDASRGEEIRACLQHGRYGQKQSDEQQCGRGAIVGYQSVDIIVQVVHQHLLNVAPVPCHHTGGSLGITRLKQDLQDRNQCCKREYVEHRR